MVRWVSRILVWLIVWILTGTASVATPPPRSILILNESEMVGPFYRAIYDALRSKLNAQSPQPVSVFLEHLELERFGDSRHEQTLKVYLESRFRDQPLGVIVALGYAALDFVLRHQSEMWSGVPVVFVMVDEAAIQRLSIPPNVTGRTARVKFGDLVSAAHAVTPNLQRLAIVGDRWEIQTAFRHFKEEIPIATTGLEIIDLVGLPMRELRKRVSTLPERTVIAYTSIFSDGEGTSYPPVDALGPLTQSANRPIVVAAETFVGPGAIGGYVLTPSPIGEEAAELVLRILGGESPSAIPISNGNVVRPIFDWRQLHRWGVSESQLPEGSEVRFRELTAWERYRWQLTAIFIALLGQTAMITWLLIERQRRRTAELDSRHRSLEVMHLSRTAEAGALSVSFAHELSQPLLSIMLNSETAQQLLGAEPPNVGRAKEILGDIRQADQHATEIIAHVKKLVKRRSEVEAHELDLNRAIADAMQILPPEAKKRNVTLRAIGTQQPLLVRADSVHLQQVILNLARNGMDAMITMAPDSRMMTIRTALLGESTVEVSVSDTGRGIPEHKLSEIFDTFYTTKEHGTGLGLSIARTIVETYGGKISAENRAGGGAVFRFTLPLIRRSPQRDRLAPGEIG
jgi:signal transduction histidine kinase